MSELSVNALINQAMRKIGPIAKSQRNQQQGFNFRGIDVVMNAIYPVFAEVGLFVTPDVMSHTCEEIVTSKGAKMFHHVMRVAFSFRGVGCDDVIHCSTIGESSDSGDKGAAKCMSIALKYALFQVLMIPLEAEADPDAHSPHLQEPELEAKQARMPAAKVAEIVGKAEAIASIKKEAEGTGWVLREDKPSRSERVAANPQANEPPLSNETKDAIQMAKSAAGFTVREIVDLCRVEFDCALGELTNSQGAELVGLLMKIAEAK